MEQRDASALVKLPGVGKKTAERLLIDMVDRIGQLEGQFVAHGTGKGGTPPARTQRQPAAAEEAEAALIALGYKPQEASRAVSRVAEEGMSREELIRQALKAMIPAT